MAQIVNKFTDTLSGGSLLIQDVGAGLGYLISGETGFGVSLNLF